MSRSTRGTEAVLAGDHHTVSHDGIDRYDIGLALGEGGFGSVYEASLLGRKGFRKRVVLKILHGADKPKKSVLLRFRDEARLLGILEHHAIVSVHGLVNLDGIWALVMEYLPGVDLAYILQEHGPMPISVALAAGERAAAALAYAWAVEGEDGQPLCLEHRDVKPANLLVTNGGALKVLDFGVARARFGGREAHTRKAGAMGSPPYMPKERWLGEGGHTADVFSLAATVLHLAVGRSWPDEPTLAACNRWRAELLDILSFQPQGTVLAKVLVPALADDPDARPSARSFRRQMREARQTLGGEPLEEWAERVVPPLFDEKRRAAAPGNLTGRVLTESPIATLDPSKTAAQLSTTVAPDDAAPDGATDPVAPTQPAMDRRLPWLIGLAGSTGIIGTLAIGAALFALNQAPLPEAPEVGTPTASALTDAEAPAAKPPAAEPPATLTAPEPVTAPDRPAAVPTVVPAAPPTTPEPVARPAPVARSAPKISPKPRPAPTPDAVATPAAEVVPEPPATPPPGRVGWTGDADAVRLMCATKAVVVPAGGSRTAPAGACKVEVRWMPGAPWTDASLSIDVPSDAEVKLDCAMWAGRCTRS